MGQLAIWGPLLLSALLGVLAGLGAYTFSYAEGLSYFSTDPRACVNCHIMQPQFDGWIRSSHHAVAVCVDCHLPSEFVPKYLAKAENGYRHGERFTTGKFEEPIVVQPAGLRILQDNCVRCHAPLLQPTMGAHDGADRGETPCVHCHTSVGHGVRAGLGGPLRASELPPTTQGASPPPRPPPTTPEPGPAAPGELP